MPRSSRSDARTTVVNHTLGQSRTHPVRLLGGIVIGITPTTVQKVATTTFGAPLFSSLASLVRR